MRNFSVPNIVYSALLAIALAACQAETVSVDTAGTDGGEAKRQVTGSPGKPAPPISVGYKLLGEPAVGEPLAIELTVSTPLPGSALSMQLQPKDDLVLGSGQEGRMELSRSASEAPGEERLSRRVSVIPQSEGRSYLVVSVSIPTDEGSAARVIAVPIQVGDLPPRLEVNGRLTGEGEDTVVSMPAKQSDN